MQLAPTLFTLLQSIPGFRLQGTKNGGELMRAMRGRLAFFHHAGVLRMPAIFVSASPAERLPQQATAADVAPAGGLYPSTRVAMRSTSLDRKCSDSLGKLHAILPSLLVELHLGKRVAILSGVPAAFIATLATEVRVRFGYNNVLCGEARRQAHLATRDSPGTLWICTYRQAAGTLKDIDALGYQCVLLDMPSNPRIWIYLNFSPSTRAPALKVIVNNTLHEQYTKHTLNVLVTKELRSWPVGPAVHSRNNVLARQLRVFVAFDAEVVQALRFFILLRCLFLKHCDLASAACRTPAAPHSALFMLDVLQRYTQTSLLYERRLCRIVSIMSLCVAAEPLLIRWLRCQPANLHPSLYVGVLGSLPPDDIQRHIASYLTEAPFDAIDMITTPLCAAVMKAGTRQTTLPLKHL